jgi:hypothetical protein
LQYIPDVSFRTQTGIAVTLTRYCYNGRLESSARLRESNHGVQGILNLFSIPHPIKSRLNSKIHGAFQHNLRLSRRLYRQLLVRLCFSAQSLRKLGDAMLKRDLTQLGSKTSAERNRDR